MRNTYRTLRLVFYGITGLLWLLSGAALAQPGAATSTGSPLLAPGQFLGYELGSRFTPHATLLRYVEHVAVHSGGRMRVQPYGSTYENRPLQVVQIGTPENLARLDDIRQNNLRLAGLASGPARLDAPAVVWLSYNIHGNEAVSSEAVMQVLYDLANPANEETRQLLQHTVLLVDPCVNPDGHERYVQWYNRVQAQVPNASPYAWEHREPWPGGRFNHYFFDLNRDWAWQTQQESRQRLALYNQWLPQVHADFHEMGPEDPYYFSPAAKPFHEDITSFQRKFQGVIGDYNRAVFDKNNWLYFTRETYDLFYPSYGDTYPSFNGAIGMTYEQGGSGRAGVRYLKTDGDTLTLTQRISHHHAASLATIRAAAERRAELVKEFKKYFDDARTAPRGPYKTFVVAGSGDPGQLRAFTEYLSRQQIQFGYAPRRQRLRGFNYFSGRDENVQIEAQDVVVSMYQPKSTLVKVLFEPRPALEDSLTYDITAWALPYSFGLKAYALKDRVAATGNAASKPVVAAATAVPAQPYAYVARWNNLQDVRFLSRLLQQKVRVRVAGRAFEAEGQQYQPGTLVITRNGNEALGSKFDQLVRAQADSAGVLVRAVQSGFSTSGADLGSGYVRNVAKPTIAVVAGSGVSPTAFGEVWHFFEQQIGYPVTVLGTDYLRTVPLAKFDVLILPDGDYSEIYSERQLEALKTWVRGGGRLIAMEGAAAFFSGKKEFLLRAKPADSSATRNADPYRLLKPYANAERAQIVDRVQGSVYRVHLDNTHPLAFGYGSTYFALIRDTLNYRFLGEGGWNVGVLKRDNYAAGFTGRGARRKLNDTFVLGAQDMGRGQVIYLADNPLFRGFWQGGKLLFGNALFFVGQ
ncbi:M14 family metallopeptidase [Hymenobacter psychrotolerans]|uniref:Zinc carboxypeptidase n=1 Tax=Hymenobacter psychrotolerans DSM 18569 TaxID=1121959 RepID=A0A1M6TZ08_9BACT|nr:M14 family metallopeptidase [Hymenobacter psychrotolerans]SHK62197.1 Zinc carboxypeptidase [Hymenobacter psychrotolerans DSM 18569]